MSIHIIHDRREKVEGYFERSVKWMLEAAFSGHEFFTLSETAKYKPSMDENVWEQNRGMRNEYVEIYYKGDWLCDVHSGMTKDQMVNKVWGILGPRAEKEKQEKLKKIEEEKKGGGII